ncbi:hypothetical protein O0L34_g417 [Tuta absoluta]|nr:hypothetical protein O0L34_g417 [Tuta absoluta]
MACGKMVFMLLAVVAFISCAPPGKGPSSSNEENSPPYHQSPVNEKQGHQNSLPSHHYNRDEAHGNDTDFDLFPNKSNSNDENSAPPPPNSSEDHQDSRESQAGPIFELDASSGFDISKDQNAFPNIDNHQDKAGLFGFEFPNFSQLFTGLGGSSGSNPLAQFIQNPLQQMVDAFGTFIPGLGGSNNTGLPNLFSGFFPHSSRSQRIELPGDLAAENGTIDGTDHMSLHDKCLFYLFSSFLQNYLGRNNANSYSSIGCNYTTQAGYSCSGCREQLICNPNNVGTIRICPRNAPYCYNGVCGSVVNTTACTTTTTG